MPRFPLGFACLVLAWVCANQPQFGVSAVVDWLRASGELSHQASMLGDLRVKLAEASDQSDQTPAVARAADDGPASEPGPAIEAAGGPRIDLALVLEMALVSPPDCPAVFPGMGMSGTVVAFEPASPVPRVRA